MLLRARKSATKKDDSGGASSSQEGSSGRLSSPQRATEPLTVTFSEDEVATVFSPFKVLLRNEGEVNMLFKVQTNIPRRYRVAPEPFGLLHPREVAVLEIFAVVEEDAEVADASGNDNNNAGHDDRSNQGGRKTPGRSRSASRSLAALLQYRERETAQEVSAESAAAIATRRESRRESFLSRRASDLRTESELSATRRALSTQMSFFSAESARESARVSGGGDAPEGAKEPVHPVETSSKSTSATRLRDLLRVEGRLLTTQGAALDSSAVKQLRKCRERHRDEWQQCASSSFVQIVPLKSEPLTKHQFVQLLAQAEEPMGIPALRAEQQAVIDAVHDLHQQLQQLEASVEYAAKSQYDQRSHLESEMARLTSLRSGCGDAEWHVVQRRALELEESDERNRVGTSANESLVELADLCAARWKVLEDAVLASSSPCEQLPEACEPTTLRADDEAVTRDSVDNDGLKPGRFDNPPPPADFPLLRGGIEVPRWVAFAAVASSVWSAILRPALYGEF